MNFCSPVHVSGVNDVIGQISLMKKNCILTTELYTYILPATKCNYNPHTTLQPPVGHTALLTVRLKIRNIFHLTSESKWYLVDLIPIFLQIRIWDRGSLWSSYATVLYFNLQCHPNFNRFVSLSPAIGHLNLNSGRFLMAMHALAWCSVTNFARNCNSKI